MLDARDVDQKVDIFTELTTSILDETVPMKGIQMHPSDKRWLTPCIKSVIKDRQCAYSKGDVEKYQQLRIQVSQLISKAKLEYYKDKVATTRTKNPAKWFKSIYSICATSGNKSNSNIPTSEDMYTIAEKLQDIFTKPWKDHTPAIPLVDSDDLPGNPPRLPNIGQVKKLLKELKPRKATSADNISAWTLKNFAEELAVVAHDILCTSISEGKYPTLYKHALVSPVPKVQPPEDAEPHFRQILVLPVFGKVLEKVQIMLYKDAFRVKGNQHAFSQGRSTISALVNITQTWFNETDKRPEGKKAIF